jgi:hypothetical protein
MLYVIVSSLVVAVVAIVLSIVRIAVSQNLRTRSLFLVLRVSSSEELPPLKKPGMKVDLEDSNKQQYASTTYCTQTLQKLEAS